MSSNVTITLTPLRGDSVGRRVLNLSPGQYRRAIGRSSLVDHKHLNPAWYNCYFENRVLSRSHAEIHAVPASKDVYLVDKNSMHGTYVNGSKLPTGEKSKLRPNDVLTFGAAVNRGSDFFEPVKVRFDVQWHDKAPANDAVKYTPPKRISSNTFVVPDDDDDDDGNEPGNRDDGDDVMVVDEKVAVAKPSSNPVEKGPAKDDGDSNHNQATEEVDDPELVESDKDDESIGGLESILDEDNCSPPPSSDIDSDSDAMSQPEMKSSPLTSSPHLDDSDSDGCKSARNQREEKSPLSVSEEAKADEKVSVDQEADKSAVQRSRQDTHDGTNKDRSVSPDDGVDDDDSRVADPLVAGSSHDRTTGGHITTKISNPRPASQPAGQRNDHREATTSSSASNTKAADAFKPRFTFQSKPVPKPWENHVPGMSGSVKDSGCNVPFPQRAEVPGPPRRRAPGSPGWPASLWQAHVHTFHNSGGCAADSGLQKFLGSGAPTFEHPLPPPAVNHPLAGAMPPDYEVPPVMHHPVRSEYPEFRSPEFNSFLDPIADSSPGPVCPAPAGGYPGNNGSADASRREWLATRLDRMIERMNDHEPAAAKDPAMPGPLSVSRSDPRAILQEHGDGDRNEGDNNALKRKYDDIEATSNQAADSTNKPEPTPSAPEKGAELPDQIELSSGSPPVDLAQVTLDSSQIDVDENQQPPRKKARTTGPRSSVSRYAATALAGAVVGGVGTVVALATLPVGYFD